MKGNQWSIRVPVGGGRLTSHDSHHRVQRFPSQQKQPIDFSRNYGNLLETDKDFWRFWMPWVEEASFISRWFCQFFQKNHHTSTSSRLSPMWASMILNVACAKEDATSFFYFPLDVFFFFSPPLKVQRFKRSSFPGSVLFVGGFIGTYFLGCTNKMVKTYEFWLHLKWRRHTKFIKMRWCWLRLWVRKLGNPSEEKKHIFFTSKKSTKKGGRFRWKCWFRWTYPTGCSTMGFLHGLVVGCW